MGLEWEVQWVRANWNQYDSKLHADSVIQNIIKRYEIKEIKAKEKEVRDCTTCAYIIDGKFEDFGFWCVTCSSSECLDDNWEKR